MDATTSERARTDRADPTQLELARGAPIDTVRAALGEATEQELEEDIMTGYRAPAERCPHCRDGVRTRRYGMCVQCAVLAGLLRPWQPDDDDLADVPFAEQGSVTVREYRKEREHETL